MNGSSVGENFDNLQKVVEVRGTEVAGSACSEGSESNVVASSADSPLDADKRPREIRVSNKDEQFRVIERWTDENDDCSILINMRILARHRFP